MSKPPLTTDDPARVAYWKSLLRIETPVCVTLAKRSMPVDRLVNLAPGVILQFEKSCESPLTLEIDDRPVADCEVIKSGDRFGVKLSRIIDKPEEWIPLIKSS
jgi:flagellar motor switch/type III secretory pathway protein FliN